MSEVPELIDHLFRREAGKMVSHLTKLFGLNNLNLAEDVVQDTLLRAMETWKTRGLPENPPAWLMRAARNRAAACWRLDVTAPELNEQTKELTEWDEPQAVIGSFLHRYAYPDWFKQHQDHNQELQEAHHHDGDALRPRQRQQPRAAGDEAGRSAGAWPSPQRSTPDLRNM